MGTLVLSGDTSGSITLDAPAIAGSSVQTLVPATGTLAPLISGTAVTASGTSVDFTGIPSWVKRITVMFSGVSTNGTSQKRIQLGTSGGVEATGYLGNTHVLGTGTFASAVLTNGIDFGPNTAPDLLHGQFVFSNLNANTWTFSGSVAASNTSGGGMAEGSKTLSGTLDRVRITTVNGTDTFDAGTINIMYE